MTTKISLHFKFIIKKIGKFAFLVRKSVAIKVAEACLKFTGFLGVNFMKWATFVLGKMIKRYKKQSRPRFTRQIKFKIFGFLIKNVVVNLKWRAKFTLSGYERIYHACGLCKFA